MKTNVFLAKKALLALFVMLMPLLVSAHDFEVDGVYYNITSSTDLTVEVTYKGKYYDSSSNEYEGLVIIPPTVTYEDVEYSITGIGKEAFRDCYWIDSITIPESVTSIGERALFGCRGLDSITIPESVTNFGKYAFENCTGELTVKCNIPYVYNGAFYCSRFTKVTIREGVTSIGTEAFLGCSKLDTIIIPESVTNIGGGAFSGTAWYNNQPDGVVYAGKVLYAYKGVMPQDTYIEVKEGTKSITHSAFDEKRNLTAITIPESVTNIGNYAFYYCENLTTITIPKNSKLTDIGDAAFYLCKKLTTITIPNSVTSIGDKAFYSCINLTTISIPEGVKSIGERTFYSSGLTTITIPKSVESIGYEAFAFGYISDVYSYAINVPNTNTNAFYGNYLAKATLHVPANALNEYKETAPWSNFGSIVDLTDEEMGVEQSVIEEQHEIYNLQGHRVTHPTKGIYIVNGKKVVIK